MADRAPVGMQSRPCGVCGGLHDSLTCKRIYVCRICNQEGHLKSAMVIAYDGFNPQTIILELATRAHNSKISDDGNFEFTMDNLKYMVPKRCDLAKDVQMLITLFLVRGNNLYKILKTISKDAKTAISSKMAAYSIKSDDDQDAAARKRKERVILASKDITLSRIAASFPHITLAVAKSAEIPGKASLVVITGQARLNGVIGSIPYILQHGMLAALLQKSEPADELNLRQFCYMFNLEQTITLQPPAVKKMMINEPLSTQIDNSVKFVSAAISVPLTSDATRNQLYKGLLEGVTEEVKAWVQAGSDAWIRALTSATYSSLSLQISNDLAAMATPTPTPSKMDVE